MTEAGRRDAMRWYKVKVLSTDDRTTVEAENQREATRIVAERMNLDGDLPKRGEDVFLLMEVTEVHEPTLRKVHLNMGEGLQDVAGEWQFVGSAEVVLQDVKDPDPKK